VHLDIHGGGTGETACNRARYTARRYLLPAPRLLFLPCLWTGGCGVAGGPWYASRTFYLLSSADGMGGRVAGRRRRAGRRRARGRAAGTRMGRADMGQAGMRGGDAEGWFFSRADLSNLRLTINLKHFINMDAPLYYTSAHAFQH